MTTTSVLLHEGELLRIFGKLTRRLTLGRCWCTDSDNYDEHGKSSDCDAECSGNDDEYCGGENSLTVSKTDDYEEPR